MAYKIVVFHYQAVQIQVMFDANVGVQIFSLYSHKVTYLTDAFRSMVSSQTPNPLHAMQ